MKTCPICNKTSAMAGTRKLLRGHYNLTNRSRKYPNLQWARVTVDLAKKLGGATAKRVLICTKCLKALAKKK